MAGSYSHIVDHNNKFRGVDLLDHLGDAYEALEECHAMIRILTGGDRTKIFEAQRAYVAEKNPECAAKMTFDKYWEKYDEAQMTNQNDTQDEAERIAEPFVKELLECLTGADMIPIVLNIYRAGLSSLACKHPGCACVCGHQGKCPEDGPIATGGTYE